MFKLELNISTLYEHASRDLTTNLRPVYGDDM